MRTAVVYALDYFAGFAVFGLVYWFLNGILVEFLTFSVQNDAYTFALWVWNTALVIYIVAGIFWLPRKLKEWEGRYR